MSYPAYMDSRVFPGEKPKLGSGRIDGMADFVSNIPGHNLGQIKVPAAARDHEPHQSQEKNLFSRKKHRPV